MSPSRTPNLSRARLFQCQFAEKLLQEKTRCLWVLAAGPGPGGRDGLLQLLVQAAPAPACRTESDQVPAEGCDRDEHRQAHQAADEVLYGW
mmetsp:Transcript_70387/g.199575  ORF Transcript_70387/g.199575 Transcript_70387/m.199575 type:complete len:91 (+) Transcript_70387:53-325(+)